MRQFGISNQGILVTSRFEEAGSQSQCQDLGVRLIPKMMVGQVPIRIDEEVNTYPVGLTRGEVQKDAAFEPYF
jgi:hypothetical protein